MKYPLIFISLLISGCINFDGSGCSTNSASVAYVRSLSEERLKKLYYDMESVSDKYSQFYRVYPMDDEAGRTPKEFSDLQVRRIDLGEGKILVEGCFDDFVILYFLGIGNYSKSEVRGIKFSYGEDYEGEYPTDEIIWSE